MHKVLCYHSIDENERDPFSVSPKEFELQLTELSKHYSFTSLDHLSTSPESILITFDDGYKNIIENAFPLMQKLGIKGVIAMPTAFIGLPDHLSAPDLQDLKKAGWAIISHTHTHDDCTQQYSGEDFESWKQRILNDFRTSKEILDKLLNQNTSAIAWPFGSNNPDTIELAKQIGFSDFFATSQRPGILRTLVYRSTSTSDLLSQLSTNTPAHPLKSFSIIIPTYNRSHLLEKVLEKISKIDYPKDLIETIVVDDGSDDNTSQMIKAIQKQFPVKYISLPRNGFQAARARHSGATLASHEIILFIDDDILVPSSILRVHNWIHSFPKAVGLSRISGFNKFITFNSTAETTRSQDNYLPEIVREKKYRSALFNINRAPSPWDCCYSTCLSISSSSYKQHPFDSSFKGYGYEDIELGFRLHQSGHSFIIARDAICAHITEQTNNDPKRQYSITPASFVSYQKNLLKTCEKHSSADLESKKSEFLSYLASLESHEPFIIRNSLLFDNHPLQKFSLQEQALLLQAENRPANLSALSESAQKHFNQWTQSLLSTIPQDLVAGYPLFFSHDPDTHNYFTAPDNWNLQIESARAKGKACLVITRQNYQTIFDTLEKLHTIISVPIFLHYPEPVKGKEELCSHYIPEVPDSARFISQAFTKAKEAGISLQSLGWHYDYAKPADLELNYDHCKPEIIVPSCNVPKVSIVVLTYNRLNLFQKTFASLQQQLTKIPFEIVVVDDGSDEDIRSALLLASTPTTYVKWPRIHNFQPGTPYNRAGPLRNLGAAHALGSILIFLDGDLIVPNDFVEEHLKKQSTSDVVIGRTVRERSGKDERDPFFAICNNDISKLPSYWTLCHSGNFSVKSSQFWSVGGFDPDYVHYGIEDEELGYKLYKKGLSFVYNNNAIALHQHHPPEFVNTAIKKQGHHYNTTVFYKKFLDNEITDRYENLIHFQQKNKKDILVLDIYNKSNDNVSNIKIPDHFMSKEELHNLFISLPSGKKVILRGGEISIRPDLFEILNCARSHGINVEIETNARFFSYLPNSQKLLQSGVKNALIYCYGHNEVIHDHITRSPGSFKQMIRGIRNLQDSGISVALQLIITPDNYLSAPDLFAFAQSLNLPAEHIAVYYDDARSIADIDSFFALLSQLSTKKSSGVKFKTGILGCQQLTPDEHKKSFMIYDVCRFCQIVKQCKGRPNFIPEFASNSISPDILFIQPSYQPHWSRCEPTGLLTLAGYIRSKGYSVQIVDLNVQSELELFSILEKHPPKLIGISMLSRQAIRGISLSQKIKQLLPAVPIIVGGIHPTIHPLEFAQLTSFDIAFAGEAELSFENLCNYYFKGIGSLPSIKGIYYRDNGQWIHTGDPELIELDDLPFLAYDLVDLSAYNTSIHVFPFHKEKAVHFMASRGCPYNCTYCTSPFLYKRKVRFQSPERIVAELKHLKNTHNITRIHFHDDDFLLHKPYLAKLCSLIKESGLEIRWNCLSNIKTIVNNLDILPLMKEAGCVGIEFGVESGDELVLKKIGKVHKNSDVLKVRKQMTDSGLILMHLLIAFSVSENIDTPYKTIRLLYEGKHGPLTDETIPPHTMRDEEVMGHLARPSPATQFYTQAQTEGLVFTETWEDQFEERINFLPNTLLDDTPLPHNHEDITSILESYKQCIEFYIEHNLYSPPNTLETTFSGIDDFLLFMKQIYHLCDSNTTVRSIMHQFSSTSKYLAVPVAISYLSILRLITSKSESLKQKETIDALETQASVAA